MDPIYVVALLFPIAFAVMWLGVTLLLSFLSGWTSLARTYRGRLSSVERTVSLGSGVMSRFGLPASYNHVLNVAVGAEGVQLSLFPLFAVGSPPLLIPWRDVAGCRSYRSLGMFDRFTFRPALCDVQITLAGAAARMLSDEVSRGALGRTLVPA